MMRGTWRKLIASMLGALLPVWSGAVPLISSTQAGMRGKVSGRSSAITRGSAGRMQQGDARQLRTASIQPMIGAQMRGRAGVSVSHAVLSAQQATLQDAQASLVAESRVERHIAPVAAAQVTQSLVENPAMAAFSAGSDESGAVDKFASSSAFIFDHTETAAAPGSFTRAPIIEEVLRGLHLQPRTGPARRSAAKIMAAIPGITGKVSVADRVRYGLTSAAVLLMGVASAAGQGLERDLEDPSPEAVIMKWAIRAAVGIIGLVFVIRSGVSTQQGHMTVLTLFGKFYGVKEPGFQLKNPFSSVRKTLSMQIRTAGDKPIGVEEVVEEEEEEDVEGKSGKPSKNENKKGAPYFEAITSDNAQVRFSYLITYKVKDSEVETIKKAVFTFIDEESFLQALTKTAEASARNYIAGVTREQVQGVREQLKQHVQASMETAMDGWGYDLIDLQITDIKFNKTVQDAMDQAVAAQQELVTATKQAEAAKTRVVKAAEGQATALETIAAARRTATEGLGPNAIIAFMWMDTIRNVAEKAGGRVNLFLDGSAQGLENSVRRLMAVSDDPNLLGRTADNSASAAGSPEAGRTETSSGGGEQP